MNQTFHTFKGETLDEAYRSMRAKLGDDALVVQTATVTEGGVFGLFARKLVQVTAAAPQPAPPSRPLTPAERKYKAVGAAQATSSTRASSPPVGSDERIQDTVAYFQKLVSDAQGRMAQSPAPARPSPSRAEGNAVVSPILPFKRPGASAPEEPSIRHEIGELRDMVKVLFTEMPGAGLPQELVPHYRALLDCGVPRKSAARLVAACAEAADADVLRDARACAECLRIEIRKRISVSGGIAVSAGKRRVIALVGPTGVGKTTNLAKLAALYAVRERARVGLVTADTYRVAATDQLKVYATIIGLDMRIAHNPREVGTALDAFAQHDVVFMDTAGGSPFNNAQMGDVQKILDAARPDETLLVLGAATPLEDLRATAARFSCLKPTSLFFTKLDETRRYGALYALAEESALPLGYFSVGQNVPDDIVLAHPGMVADMVVRTGEKRGGSSPKTS